MFYSIVVIFFFFYLDMEHVASVQDGSEIKSIREKKPIAFKRIPSSIIVLLYSSMSYI